MDINVLLLVEVLVIVAIVGGKGLEGGERTPSFVASAGARAAKELQERQRTRPSESTT